MYRHPELARFAEQYLHDQVTHKINIQISPH